MGCSGLLVFYSGLLVVTKWSPSGMGLNGWDGSPGGVKYRAPYVANKALMKKLGSDVYKELAGSFGSIRVAL